MSKKIIIPEGMELIRYLNEGYPICNKCGTIMDREDKPDERSAVYICPSCEWTVDVLEYEYEDDEEKEWTPEMLNMYGGNVPPAGCRACGGPYPYCETSCGMFDD